MLTIKRIRNLIISLLIIFYNKQITAQECNIKPVISVGILENNFIDYTYYIYYALGKYSLENNVEYKVEKVKNNPEKFDVIFGEYRDLVKLSLRNISLPNILTDFYNKNEIEVTNNLLPLDLDTFIILSLDESKKFNLEDFSNYYSNLQYTLGMSFKIDHNVLNLINYELEDKRIDLNSHTFESNLKSFTRVFKNSNRSLINSNYLEVYNSYKNKENIFTLFNDGILLYKNIEYNSFQLFPKSKYFWNDEKGIFKKRDILKPYSFYGLSAYINNTENIGFICYMIDKDIREKGFREFNIQLSPFSIKDTYSIEKKISSDYREILNKKNKYIQTQSHIDRQIEEKIKKLIFNKIKYEDLFDFDNYLN